MALDLLKEPIFRVETSEGPQRLSLPGLMAALGKDRVEGYVGLQRHQEEPFHVFLCCLGVAILARQGDDDPLQSEGYWRRGLEALAVGHEDTAWSLVVDDLSRPAFMQPPLPAGEHQRMATAAPIYTPDGLDPLNTAKNHDVKQERGAVSPPDLWVYALINLQTMSGYFGKGKYGIVRMNGGYGNRSIVEVIPSVRWGERWKSSVSRLLRYRKELLDGPWGYASNGLLLLWLREWDGKESLSLAGLDPNFIEICRRVRLFSQSTTMMARMLMSECPRIAGEELKGLVGDPWLPEDLEKETALTVSGRGWTADLLRRILFADRIKRTILQEPIAIGREMCWLSASVLVRGQGVTEGYHHRLLPIPPGVQRHIFRPSQTDSNPLADLAGNAVAAAGEIQQKVLKPALFVVMEGAPDNLSFDNDTVKAWYSRSQQLYTDRWSDCYFPWLWERPEEIDVDHELDQWRLQLREMALEVLEFSMEALPGHSGRRWRTMARARQVFHGSFNKIFPHLRGRR